MARRKQDDNFEMLVDIFKMVPFWVGPILALLVFLIVRYGGPKLFPAPESGFDSNSILRQLMPLLSWVFSGFLVMAWIFAEGLKLKSRFRLNRQTGIDSIRGLGWQEFEHLVAEAYRRRGYMAEVVGSAAGDGGIDVELNGHGETVLIQCKQWKAFKVGVKPVRELLGVVTSRNADRGILITSGKFTSEAECFARESNIELIDGDGVAALVLDAKKAPTSTKPKNLHSQPQPSANTAKQRSEPPSCPSCGAAMVLRTARRGADAGSQFWGCPKYPSCRGTRQYVQARSATPN